MNCPDEFGVYDKMIEIEFPTFMLQKNGGYYETKRTCQLDPCIVDEIKYLWSVSIHTMGSCCGHGKALGMINVLREEDEEKMVNLGYEYYPNRIYPRTFIAKSKH